MKILKSFPDDQFPYQGIEKTRNTVRGIIFNDDFEVAILRIDTYQDIFGHRNHYEIIGGGVEKGETLFEAAQREALEESGASIEDIRFHGKIENIYHPLKQKVINNIFSAKAKKVGPNNLQEDEKTLVKTLEWIDCYKLLDILENFPTTGVGKLIHRRDLFILKLVLKELNIQNY